MMSVMDVPFGIPKRSSARCICIAWGFPPSRVNVCGGAFSHRYFVFFRIVNQSIDLARDLVLHDRSQSHRTDDLGRRGDGTFTKGGPPRQILRKIFLRYIQNRMNQKISITAKPWSAG